MSRWFRGKITGIFWVLMGQFGRRRLLIGPAAGLGMIAAAACALDFEHYRPGDPVACTAGEARACYPFDDLTRGVGQCVEGTHRCLEDGSGFGPCEGAVAPAEEDCSTLLDEDCDDSEGSDGSDAPDDDCACVPGVTYACYEGSADTVGNGICVAGEHECHGDGLTFTPCQGQVLPLGELCVTSTVDEDCDGLDLDHCANWAHRFGDAADQQFEELATRQDGKVVAVGHFDGVVTFGSTPLVAVGKDAFVALFDPVDGTHEILKHITGPDTQKAETVALDSNDDIYLAGSFHGNLDLEGNCSPLSSTSGDTGTDVFVAKLDGATFQCQWATVAEGSGSDYPMGLDTDGELVVVTGRFKDELTVGTHTIEGDPPVAWNHSAFVAAFEATGPASGDLRWLKSISSPSTDEGRAVVITPGASKAVVAVGNVRAPARLPDGTIDPADDDSLDAYVVWLDPADGNQRQWHRYAGGGWGLQEAQAVASVGNDQVAVAINFDSAVLGLCGHNGLGSPYAGRQIWVAVMDESGACAPGWPQVVEGVGHKFPRHLAIGLDGQVVLGFALQKQAYFAGLEYNAPVSGQDPRSNHAVAVFTADGDPLWLRHFGDDAGQTPNGIAVSGSTVLIAGDCRGTMDYGTGPLEPDAQTDNFDACIAGLRLLDPTAW